MDQTDFRSGVQYQRGLACMDMHDYAAAAAHFSKAIFLFPGQPQLYMHRGEAYLKALDINSAVTNFKKAIQLIRDEEVSAVMREKLTSLLDCQGCLAFTSGQFVKALQCFTDALPHNPDSTILIFHRGVAQYKLGLYPEATADFQKCSSDVLLRPFPVLGLALSALRMNSLKESKAHIEKVATDVNVSVQNVQAVFQQNCDRRQARGRALIAEQKFEEAGRIFDELIETNPDDAEAYRLRSCCLSGLGMYSAAVQDLFESISKSGGGPTMTAGMAQLSETLVIIAEDLTRNGDHVQALEYFTEAIKWGEGVVSLYVKRGQCYEKLQRQEPAMADYQHALTLDPNHEEAKMKLGMVYDRRGVALYNLGKPVEAAAEFTKAVDACAGVPLFHFHRAQCQILDPSTRPEGVRDLQRCLELGTTDREILRAAHTYCPRGPAGAESAA
eukprot:RCo030162